MVTHLPYQHVGFHFCVCINLKGQARAGEINGGSVASFDANFQSVSGLDAEIETENVKEGGENHFEHKLPVRRRFGDLVLKRGILAPADASFLTDWCVKAVETMKIVPLDLDILLLNDTNHEAIMKWKVIHAWPKKWKFGELNAERSEVLIETIEFNYNRIEFKNP
jgi:phage tail-like protein